MRIAVVLLSLLAAGNALAQCKDTLRAMSEKAIGMSLCPGKPFPAVGDPLVIAVGGGQVEATVTASDATLGTQLVNASITDPTKAQDNMLLLSGATGGTVKYGTQSVAVTIQQGTQAQDYFKWNWSLGPATTGDPDGDSSTPPPANGGTNNPSGAARFQYDANYARGGLFGYEQSRLWQTTASLTIDTTDQDAPQYVDNNEAAVGVQLTGLSLGRLWMHGTTGIEASYEKAFHRDANNLDATVKVTGWVPAARSFTLFSDQGEFIAAPLSFEVSYGYRKQHESDASYDGTVFQASALYYLYLFDQYQVTFSGTLTYSDLSNRPPTTPATQRMYKAEVAYLASNATGFKVVTSFESGSIGLMLNETRQYFIGIALDRLNLGGGGGN